MTASGFGWSYDIRADAGEIRPGHGLFIFYIEAAAPDGRILRSPEAFGDPLDAAETMLLLGSRAPSDVLDWTAVTAMAERAPPTSTFH